MPSCVNNIFSCPVWYDYSKCSIQTLKKMLRTYILVLALALISCNNPMKDKMDAPLMEEIPHE